MFEKVIIAEDFESSSISVRKTLEELGVERPQFAYYCDDALLRVKKAITGQCPFDLLITDLSFVEDQPQQLKDGKALIRAVRALQPEIKVLVFSAENRPAIINGLFSELAINGYVSKGRRDSTELRAAIERIGQQRTYRPSLIRDADSQKNTHDFSEVDIEIIRLIASGVPQKEIPDHLVRKQLKPSGLSSVEKRLALMKSAFDFHKNEQLVILCRDLGLI